MIRLLQRAFVLTLMAWAACVPGAGAEETSGVFRRLTLADGLINNVVYGVVQDTRGFIWLGTEGGLVRHDGNEFRLYELVGEDRRDPVRQDISALHRGSDNVIWVGTWGGGLAEFDPVAERTRRFRRDSKDPRTLSDDRVQTIFEDRSGRIWVGTFNGLNRLDTRHSTFVRIQHVPGQQGTLSHSRIWSISQAPDGRLWVGTEAGLDVLDPTGRLLAHHDLPLPDDARVLERRARVVFHDRSGALWVGGQQGLYRFNTKGDRLEPFGTGQTTFSGEIVTQVVEGPDGSLWVGTLAGGLASIAARRDAAVRYRADPWHPGRLAHGDVRALLVDRSGLLWIGTRGGGVGLLDLRPPIVELFGHRWGAPAAWTQEVAAVYEDSTGAIWAGSLEGLRRWDRHGVETRFVHDRRRPESLSPDLVRDIVEDGRGGFWIATLNGLDRLDPKTGRFQHFRRTEGDRSQLTNSRINTVIVDRRGRTWVGTQNGLNRLDPGATAFVPFRTGDMGLTDDYVRVVLEDRSGTIWVGTEVGGLCRWREPEGRFDCYRHGPEEDTLSDDRVFALHEAETGSLWIGTDNGLNALDPQSGRIRRFGAAQGVPTTDVYGILSDRSGALWLSSGRGLFRYDPESERARSFSEVQGLQGLAFSRGATHAARDGSLLFGGLSGVLRVFPDRALPDKVAPPVVVTDVLVDEVRLAQPVGTLSELMLSWRMRSFRASFATLDFRSPKTHQFSYKLEGFDQAWRSAGLGAQASYTNLKPGDYVLRVRGSNGEGGWNEAGFALPIHIRPPVWNTTLFRLALFLLLPTLIAALVIARVAMLNRKQRELGELVAERTAQLVEANSRLEQLARTDGLTELANYRAFAEGLDREWIRTLRSRVPLSIVMIDVDRFKAYNDMFGHRAGDDALRRVADRLVRLGQREGDLVARYGGDEFVMLLAGTDREGAIALAERARASAEAELQFESEMGPERLTLSLGVATTVPATTSTSEDLLRAADQALYEAKRRGRNCVVSRVLVPAVR